jgi:hypothetical protein
MNYRWLRWAIPLLVFSGAVAVSLKIGSTLGDIRAGCYTLESSEAAISSALRAAYLYGEGREAYGLDNPPTARHQRPWAADAERLTTDIIHQPWFPAYCSALEGFERRGIIGFLTIFDKAAVESTALRHDELFLAFVSQELPGHSLQTHRRAVTRYFMGLGYDQRLQEPFTSLTRLLIANFVAPAEARGCTDSLGMDKLTHYYHSRHTAAEHGILYALGCSVELELAEFFFGHHHKEALWKTLGNWGNFSFDWQQGWPRLYPTPAFFQEHRPLFKIGEVSYAEWRAQVSQMPFGWGDIVAGFLGAASVAHSPTDIGILLLFAAVTAIIYKHRRRRHK